MKENVESLKTPLQEKPSEEAIMAETIRVKLEKSLRLTPREELFLAEQRAQNRRDDNPRYGHY